jgi:hypothetical protein
MREHFFAPWSTKLKLTTGGLGAILIIAAVATAGWGSLVILAIILVAAAFAIRGYSVMDSKLLIHRLGWANKFDLTELQRVEVSPGATMGSLRTMGIGGLFGFVGHFHNEILGSYKAYATNEFNTVVMVFGNETIVVTPDDPEEFVEAVTAASRALSPAAEPESAEE